MSSERRQRRTPVLAERRKEDRRRNIRLRQSIVELADQCVRDAKVGATARGILAKAQATRLAIQARIHRLLDNS